VGNEVHHTATVGPHVELGEGNYVGPHAVLAGAIRLGDDNWIGAGTVIGAPPEIRDFPHAPSWTEHLPEFGVEIGHRNVIREMVTIQHGSRRPTRIGNDCFLMTRTYAAHDVHLEDTVTTSAGVSLAGHVQVGSLANLGMGALVHQFRVIGAGVMIGMGAVVTHNVPPFAKAFGNPTRIHGANLIGLRRLGLDDETVALIAAAHDEQGAWPAAEELGPLSTHLTWWLERQDSH
jgi:UDP-N-acetylglucosamine acyltransferase